MSSAQDQRTPPILAIDTSSAQGGIGIYDGQMLATRSWPAERFHTTTLLSEIHHVLDRASLEVADLAAIAIAIGPGAFTGLRVGIGVAKGFHLATSVPLIGIPTLEATALPFALCGRPVVSAVTAGRGRLVWARYEPRSGDLSETRPPRNGTVVELAEELQNIGSVIVTGELDDEQVRVVAPLDGITLPSRSLRARQPAAFAELGLRRFRAGSVDDATTLEPIYLSR